MAVIRKICVVTGTRAEYGLLYWLIKEIEDSDKFALQLIVTGMHLAPEFGLTCQQIEEDGFLVSKKVEMLLSSDSEIGITKSMGLGMIGFADALDELRPDLMLVLGDRFEIFSAVSAAMITRIPVAHLHGGEATEGLIDEPIRHSVTKMSHLHFTATEEYRNRVIQLGEHPERVFNVGAIGVENISRLKLLDKKGLEEAINFKLGIKNILVTFHPVTLENETAEAQFENLLDVLDGYDDLHVIFTKSNADTNGRVINTMIDQYVVQRPDTTICFASLGQLRYLSALQFMDGIVGNSSSGLLEAPSFQIGTVNIGDRQRGRIRADSVIDCDSDSLTIQAALNRLFSDDFKLHIRTITNPYDSCGTVDKVMEVLGQYPLDDIQKKSFFDIKFSY